MNITLHFFGELAELFSITSIEIPTEADTEMLVQKLVELNSSLKSKTFLLAINHQIVTSTQALKPNDVVALLPPFSGG